VFAACAAIAVSVSSWAQSAKPTPPTKRTSCLCEKQEERFFSCQTARGKSIALCGGGDGVVQYRYGTRGKIELRYPTKPDNSLQYAGYMRFQTESYEITFSDSGAKYSVFEYTEDSEHSAGVRVVKTSGEEVVFECAGKVFSRLSKLESRLPCDKDNALNLDGCPQSPR
jgi:hypothetical protein